MHTKGWMVLLSFLFMATLFSLSFVSAASSVNQEIQRLTHYAQEYEIGNINYAQFSVYLASVEQNLNEVLGASKQNHDETLKSGQLEEALGPPTEKTEWIWVEKEDREIRLEKEIPVWRRNVYDGKKIQIKLNAWPHFRRANESEPRYRLHSEIIFKRPQDAFDPQETITKIQSLAEKFNADPTSSNADTLARESVMAERRFNEMLERSPEVCESTISTLLGTNAQRREQKTVRKEITLYEGKNYDGMLMLESCDDCDWRWINTHAFVNSRGRGYPGENDRSAPNQEARRAYKDYTSVQFKEEITSSVNAMVSALQEKKSIREHEMKLRTLNDAWNEQSNNIYNQIDENFRKKRESLTSAQQQQYDWQSEEQERRTLEQQSRTFNYLDRINFYNALFAPYKMREQRFHQVSFERRLIDTKRTVTAEMCGNEKDDDGDTLVDCADDQCGGNICGSKEIAITQNGSNFTVRRDMFCMQKVCSLKPDAAILQPHELNRIDDQPRQTCKQHPAIECDGIVLFKGKDANNCPLQPVCIASKSACTLDSECPQPRCGTVACIENACKVTRIEACKESACLSGQEKTQQCSNGETLIVELCVEGSWQSTFEACESPATTNQNQTDKPPVSPVPLCKAREECAENEVCSNGQCEALPEVHTPVSETELTRASPASQEKPTQLEDIPKESAESKPSESSIPPSESEKITSNLLTPLRFISSLITGRVTNTEENTTPQEKNTTNEPNNTIQPTQNESMSISRNESTRDRNESHSLRNDSNTRRNETHDFPRTNESQNRQNETHYEENRSMGQYNEQREQPQIYEEQLGVFQVGGSCQKSQERQEGNIHFGGWGKPFEIIEPLKQSYYQTGGEWCQREYENLVKQRRELEQSFNEEFAAWFFEKHMANGADDWETLTSGIFNLYWRDVELSQQLSQRLDCLDQKTLPPHTLMSFKYETEYGKIEFWEELKHLKLNPQDEQAVDVITPYMKVFLFPPKEFIVYELQKAMEAREFPGSPEDRAERESEEGLTEEEKTQIRRDKKFMRQLREAIEQYDGNLDVSLRLIEPDKSVVFNLYVQVNEEDIMKIKPMPPAAQPAQDILLEVNFDEVYDLMDFIQREMEGGHLESPPWDRKPRRVTDTAKEMYNGIKVWFRVQSLIKAIEVTPKEQEEEMQDLMKAMVWKMMTKGDHNEGNGPSAHTGKEMIRNETVELR